MKIPSVLALRSPIGIGSFEADDRERLALLLSAGNGSSFFNPWRLSKPFDKEVDEETNFERYKLSSGIKQRDTAFFWLVVIKNTAQLILADILIYGVLG